MKSYENRKTWHKKLVVSCNEHFLSTWSFQDSNCHLMTCAGHSVLDVAAAPSAVPEEFLNKYQKEWMWSKNRHSVHSRSLVPDFPMLYHPAVLYQLDFRKVDRRLGLCNIKLQHEIYEIMNLFWLEVHVHLHASTPNFPSWKDPQSPTFLHIDRRKVWVAPFIQVMYCALILNW